MFLTVKHSECEAVVRVVSGGLNNGLHAAFQLSISVKVDEQYILNNIHLATTFHLSPPTR